MYPVTSRYAAHSQPVGQLQPVVGRLFGFFFPDRFYIYGQADDNDFLFVLLRNLFQFGQRYDAEPARAAPEVEKDVFPFIVGKMMYVPFRIFQLGIRNLISFLNCRRNGQKRGYFFSQLRLSLLVRQLAVNRHDQGFVFQLSRLATLGGISQFFHTGIGNRIAEHDLQFFGQDDLVMDIVHRLSQ